jgi:hypothetical protein
MDDGETPRTPGKKARLNQLDGPADSDSDDDLELFIDA